MKKLSIIVLLVLVSIILCGCESNKKEKVIINNESVNTASMVHKHCTREGALTGAEVKLEYDVYYTGDVLNLLISTEGIVTADEELLNTYEDAYKKIHEHYKELEYYDTEVVRGDTTVTSIMRINYDKIDIPKLIEIEGTSDNIFENNVAKLSKWMELAEKVGMQCEIVEE